MTRSFGHFGIYGYGFRCAVPECRNVTAIQAPSGQWRQAATAVQAAARLGWITARLEPGEAPVWFCPMHQKFDEHSGRWVPRIQVAA